MHDKRHHHVQWNLIVNRCTTMVPYVDTSSFSMLFDSGLCPIILYDDCNDSVNHKRHPVWDGTHWQGHYLQRQYVETNKHQYDSKEMKVVADSTPHPHMCNSQLQNRLPPLLMKMEYEKLLHPLKMQGSVLRGGTHYYYRNEFQSSIYIHLPLDFPSHLRGGLDWIEIIPDPNNKNVLRKLYNDLKDKLGIKVSDGY
jgi:hypothetical protein